MGAFRLIYQTLKVNIQFISPLLYFAHMFHITGINVGVLYITSALRLVGLVGLMYVLLIHCVLTGAFRPAAIVPIAYMLIIVLVFYVACV